MKIIGGSGNRTAAARQPNAQPLYSRIDDEEDVVIPFRNPSSAEQAAPQPTARQTAYNAPTAPKATPEVPETPKTDAPVYYRIDDELPITPPPARFRTPTSYPQAPARRISVDDDDDTVPGADLPQRREPTSRAGRVKLFSSLPSTRHVKAKPVKKRMRWYYKLGIAVLVCAALYLTAVYSSIPFIAKWRCIYIETAMSTMTKQWLATAFIPKPVIDEVVNARYQLDEEQRDMVSDSNLVKPKDTSGIGIMRPGVTTSANPAATTTAASTSATSATSATSGTTAIISTTTAATTAEIHALPQWIDPEHPLYLLFPELDVKSFSQYAKAHEDTMYDADGYLFIDKADRDGKGTSIKTTNGDTVLAVDTRNGILLVAVTGEGFHGVLAIVRNPAQVGLVVSSKLGKVGERIPQLCEDNGAILGINASGFYDPDGDGNGGSPYGYVVSNGKEFNGSEYGDWKVVGFTEDNILYTGAYKSLDVKLRDAAEFKPLLINNGELVVTLKDGWGINPRTQLGQTSDGSVLMLVINGRSLTSLGCKSLYAAEILLKYGAVQASALDGGSSSVMYYNGRVITYPSGANKTDGRKIPNAFVVFKN